ncbi:hypothetical protein IV102_05230 [bacterium]|nr:hypothetical protein [bacterium]
MSRASRGHTLIEVVVAASLTLLIGLLFLNVLWPAMRSTARNATRISLQQSALMGLNRISKDLQAAPPAGVGLAVNPTVLSVHKIVDVVTTSPVSQIYDDHLVVYAYDPVKAILLRRVWPETEDPNQTLDGILKPPTPLLAVRPLPGSLGYFGSHPGDRDRKLLTQIRSFSITSAVSPPQISPPLRLNLELEAPLAGGGSYRFLMNQSVSLRQAE